MTEKVFDAITKQEFVAETFSSTVRIGWRATRLGSGLGSGFALTGLSAVEGRVTLYLSAKRAGN